jgi:hypothetical protein
MFNVAIVYEKAQKTQKPKKDAKEAGRGAAAK